MFKNKNLTPEARAQRANRSVVKALAVFSNAADELDKAADEQYVAEEQFLAAAESARQAAVVLDEQAAEAYEVGATYELRAADIRKLATV